MFFPNKTNINTWCQQPKVVLFSSLDCFISVKALNFSALVPPSESMLHQLSSGLLTLNYTFLGELEIVLMIALQLMVWFGFSPLIADCNNNRQSNTTFIWNVSKENVKFLEQFQHQLQVKLEIWNGRINKGIYSKQGVEDAKTWAPLI